VAEEKPASNPEPSPTAPAPKDALKRLEHEVLEAFQPEGPSLIRSFGRSQVASLIATLVDFGALVLFTELAHVWYVASTAIGAFLGGVTNFLLGRYWSFQAHQSRVHGQALRYSLVSGGSLVLNAGGVWALTEYLRLAYPASKAVIAVLVSVGWNFPLQRHFVFRHRVR
jgi:putative flippase GtrA